MLPSYRRIPSDEEFRRDLAYKAETNFVDVIPQAKRLRLSINMTFAEINDPKGLCKDVTNVGHQGNGDVDVSLKSLDELPYIMGLVRQSYERQMGDDVAPGHGLFERLVNRAAKGCAAAAARAAFAAASAAGGDIAAVGNGEHHDGRGGGAADHTGWQRKSGDCFRKSDDRR